MGRVRLAAPGHPHIQGLPRQGGRHVQVGRVGQRDLGPCLEHAEPDELLADHGREAGRLLVRARQEKDVPAQKVIRHVQGHRLALGLAFRCPADPAPRVISPDGGRVTLPERKRGSPLPFRGEPPDLGQLVVPEVLGDQAHDAARFHRPELGRVALQHEPR